MTFEELQKNVEEVWKILRDSQKEAADRQKEAADRHKKIDLQLQENARQQKETDRLS